MSKMREGRYDNINYCNECNHAYIDHTFMWRTLFCLVNPRACNKTKMIIEEDMIAKYYRLKICVIRSGPSGLELSTTAEFIGHCLTLYDKYENIRGQFNMARRIPEKGEFHETMWYL